LFTAAVSDPNTEQIHDFEPGIAPSGLFWTIPIDGSAVDASPGSGRARYRLDELALNDYHDFFTAISPNPPNVPSHVSFEVVWSGGSGHQRIADTDFDFTGTFVTGDARIAFTAWNDGTGVVYASNPNGQTSDGAGVGHERNGVFF
jgi:hypothetical protein